MHVLIHKQFWNLSAKLVQPTANNLIMRTCTSSVINEKGKLVYENTNKKYVVMAKGFSLFTSALFLSAQPFLISQMTLTGPMSYTICGGISTLSFATPFLLHYLTRAFVTHIYYNENSNLYTAITKSMFLTNKSIVYSAQDTKIPELNSPLATIVVKDKPLLVYLEYFKNTATYCEMIKFDENLTGTKK